VSASCNQGAQNNVNNGEPETPIKPETTGTLVIIKSCRLCPSTFSFSVQVTGNNPNPSSFTLSNGQSQSVTLGPGSFTVNEVPVPGFFPPSFSGDCREAGSSRATGTISAGQHLTCTILNSQS
jgi:hypothetical protein